MIRIVAWTLFLCALSSYAPLTARAITINTVPIGNAGNANDPATGNLYGGVSYDYRIGTTEVTVGQYTAFLNAVAATDTYQLYLPFMGTDLAIAGIVRSGASGNYSYSVMGSASHPVSYVGWGDAARFSNWLHNGQPTGPQGAGTTETGSYTLNGATTQAALNAVTRNSGATWVIPSENEWYKAAYYQPAAQGGDSDNYWAYPTGTNLTPTSAGPPGGSNTVNSYEFGTGFALTGSTSMSSTQNYLTNAGAYSSSSSFYGTFDQGGNVFEWNEALISGYRVMRGGSWQSTMPSLSASIRVSFTNLNDSNVEGFRVAFVPEPSTAVLAIVGLAAVMLFRARRRGLATSVVATSMLGLCVGFSSSAQAVTIPTVPVGNAGNIGEVQPQGTFGAVAYDYRIGTTEVTNAQYAEFLNFKAASDPLGLYNSNMHHGAFVGGITRSGVNGSFTYTTKTNMGDKPVNFVSWYDSLRFANWLHNGQGTGDTETGAYTLLGGTATPSNGVSITRNVGATWFLPSEDEWYKAAYHQSSVQGGDSDDYWLYPTASNSAPAVATANSVGDISNPGANVANYNFGADWNSQNGNVTTVGSAGPLSESYYDTSDQGGNVYEWNEALVEDVGFDTNRGMRGGSFRNSAAGLQSSFRDFNFATNEVDVIGFRVASVPEPSTAALAIVGLAAALLFRARRRGLATSVVATTMLSLCLGLSSSAQAITISTVPVGNLGNAHDPATGGLYGGAGYGYRIGTTEVTVGQYTAFLNAVAATDTYALYNTSMAADLNITHIAQSGASGSYTYSVIGSTNHPVTYVGWGDAARFSNWLHNGQPTGAQNASTTENGAYPLNGAITQAALNAISRNASAQWFIPTENEWYKAAYHQPAGQGGDTDNYWDYPTQTNSTPYSDQPPGSGAPTQSNTANFFRNDLVVNGYDDGYAVTGSTVFSSAQNYLTNVGAYTSATSPYGTFDQGGNVWEWTEVLIGGSSRGVRGSSWNNISSMLLPAFRATSDPTIEGGTVGFRVATVPEPGTAVLAAVGLAAVLLYRARKYGRVRRRTELNASTVNRRFLMIDRSRGGSVARRLSCVLVVLHCIFVGSWARQASAEMVVMTRNLYLGSGLNSVINAIAGNDPAQIAAASSAAYANVLASNFAERAVALAAEVEQTQPTLIGLQEVSLFRSGPINDPATATNVELDYLQMFLGALSARGLNYHAVAVNTLTDSETPSSIGGVPHDVRLTDRDVILARSDLTPAELSLSNVQQSTFATNLTVPISGGGNFTVLRGWQSVDVQADGLSFRFGNTHLEPGSVGGVQVAQGNELIAQFGTLTEPVVLVGDLNSRADGLGTATYANMLGAGFGDAWTQVNLLDPGFTYGQDLFDPVPEFGRRIDLILTRGGMSALAAEVVGDDPAGRTPSGIWPSDHAGVVATVVPEPSSLILAAFGTLGLTVVARRRRLRAGLVAQSASSLHC